MFQRKRCSHTSQIKDVEPSAQGCALNRVVPPTGKRFIARQSHWFRVADGKLVEHWATRDDLTAMLQLGILQPPGRPAL